MLPSATETLRRKSLTRELAYLSVHFDEELSAWNKGESIPPGNLVCPKCDERFAAESESDVIKYHDRWVLLTALIEHAQATIR